MVIELVTKTKNKDHWSNINIKNKSARTSIVQSRAINDLRGMQKKIGQNFNYFYQVAMLAAVKLELLVCFGFFGRWKSSTSWI